jgi:autophagy-related protein 5
LAYLPFILPRLHSFFSTALINEDALFSDAWFSYEGVPLKWHYPVGLLYDLYAGNDPHGSPVISDEDDPLEDINSSIKVPLKPWKLTVHFSAWPEEHLVKLDADGKYLHDAFFNTVKEVFVLRSRVVPVDAK